MGLFPVVGLQLAERGAVSQPCPWQHPGCRLQLPGHGWQRLQHPRAGSVRTTPLPGPPPARAAPSPAHSSAARAEPQRQRWPPPRGLDPEKLLSSPSTRQQRGKGGEKVSLLRPGAGGRKAGSRSSPRLGIPTHRGPAAPVPSVPSCPVLSPRSRQGSGSSWPLGSDEGPERGSLSTPPPPHVSPPKLQRKSRALGAKSYKTRGKRKIISCCRKCCKQGEGRALRTARARESRVNTSAGHGWAAGWRGGKQGKQAGEGKETR